MAARVITGTDFLKRYWLICLLIALLLLLAPPFIDSFARLFNTVASLLEKVFNTLKLPGHYIEGLRRTGQKIIDKVVSEPRRKWLIIGALFFLLNFLKRGTIVGAAVVLWGILDYFKPVTTAPLRVLPPEEVSDSEGVIEGPPVSLAAATDTALEEYFG